MSAYLLGIDIGSTTVKIVILGNENNIIYSRYERHFADIKHKLEQLLLETYDAFNNLDLCVSITGSGGMKLALSLGIPFIQEVAASAIAVRTDYPDTDVALELGGEDAKIVYFTGGIETRMNGTCAGGTGSFIDQMAYLLKTDAQGLNELAKGFKTIYPIASRCGVFAKSDIQPLLNEGAAKENIAASVFQAVVIQTESALACGRPIRGKVAFLGGPLAFLSELRNRFIENLRLKEDEVILPSHPELFIAKGAALSAKGNERINLKELIARLKGLPDDKNAAALPKLFNNEEEYRTFKARHHLHQVLKRDLSTYSGKAYLGIDAGSTTTKLALIDEEGALLYTWYGSNEGSPLKRAVQALINLYGVLKDDTQIVSSAVTGYGEGLLKAALNADLGTIETVAHYKAARFFLNDVDFILDIGGQDMKCLKVKNGNIESIFLNEACSSGCGSFLDTFAQSLGMNIEEFAEEAVFSDAPVDLGSRCTVFMNSKVKHAQKEGADIGDISAGLSYSVIKNALYKVIKIRNYEELGDRIVVQGGTFYNDSVLRAFETLTGREVVRPDIAGIMGAFGAALAAKEELKDGVSRILGAEALKNLSYETEIKRCGGCPNHCLLTIHHFQNNHSYISGNRCERGAGIHLKTNRLPNLYQYKYNLIFENQPLEKNAAPHGIVGIPRVLNIYENYPFWFTFFTELGFRVELSEPSNSKIYEKGIETIPSETVCYPGKLVHGHIMNLMERQIPFIFYPSIVSEVKEYKGSDNRYNCPIVASYSEVARINIDGLSDVYYANPFLDFENPRQLAKSLKSVLQPFNIPEAKVNKAIKKAYQKRADIREKLKQKGEETLKYIEENHVTGIVLAGRPYHIDPHINHGIPDMLNSLGFAVLTEDAISHLSEPVRPLRVVDQWAYHSRLYAAASYVASRDDLELVQLNSFGCGLDSVASDMVEEILNAQSKLFTLLKIDEVSNLGAARIRMRSLQAAVEERRKNGFEQKLADNWCVKIPFTKAMKEKHTILAPNLSPVHFELLKEAFNASGYRMVLLPAKDPKAIEEGLKCVNNDACYPALIIVGQLIAALKSGEYDPNHTSVIISQTGGSCRATNYIGYLRKALKDSGFENIPVISLSATGIEKNPGFNLSVRMVYKMVMAITYGDVLSSVLYRTRPYELNKGDAERLYNRWMERCQSDLKTGNFISFRRNIREIVREFSQIKKRDEKKPRIGIVGEILLKYHPTGNNGLVETIEAEGAEVILPNLADFFLYCAHNSDYKYNHLSGTLTGKILGDALIRAVEFIRKPYRDAFKKNGLFFPPKTIYEIAEKAKTILSLGNFSGEGWLLTGEMVELLENGVKNILCVQPFACLPNHITGRGVLKALKKQYPDANLIAVDYDPGASEVNQLNRIKLMISQAFETRSSL